MSTITLQEALKLGKYTRRAKISEELQKSLSIQYGFVIKDIKYLKKNFLKMAPKGIMDLSHWKNTLGIMNIPKAEFLAKQIFRAIDTDKDSLAFFEDYVRFTHILTMGSTHQKAEYSFRLLDKDNKGYIEEEDVYNMMSSIFELWNILTNSKVVVLPEYVETVFQHLDKDNDKKIDLEEYQTLYANEELVFGWFEYLNQEEAFMKEILRQKAKKELKKAKMKSIKNDIGNCMKILLDLESCRIPRREYSPDEKPSQGGRHHTSDSTRLDYTRGALTTRRTEKTRQSGITTHHGEPYTSRSGVSTGRIHLELVTSRIKSAGGFSGPQLEIDEKVPLPPLPDSIPPFHPEDFDFDIPDPQHLTQNTQSGQLTPPSRKDRKSRFRDSSDASTKNINLLRRECADYMDEDEAQHSPLPHLAGKIKERLITMSKEIDSLDNESSIESDEELENLQEEIKNRRRGRRTSINTFKFIAKKEKKRTKNLKLFFGHENWNLMMNMLIGFRAGIKMLLFKGDLVKSDFTHIVRHDINNVTFTNAFDKSKRFIMYEYAPYVFNKIRGMIGFTERQYMKSLGPENILGNLLLGNLHTMSELASEGKSGSLFYLTHDSKFYVKTISKAEHDQAFRILEDYYHHLKRNPNTLLCKITNLYKIETHLSGRDCTLYVCVMKNLFSELSPDSIYDLKGSTQGRSSRKGDVEKSSVLKDLDWSSDAKCFKFDKGLQSYMFQILESDAFFLRKVKSMDYSLLVGIHDVRTDVNDMYLGTLRRQIERTNRYPNGVKVPIHKVSYFL